MRDDGTVDVYLISGFLGSGKTTFLNRLIKAVPEELTFLILMNEFGEVGLDGTLIEGEDVDLLEISKGSIFCACVKTDFVKGLVEISKNIRPDIMLIETTGVANPSDLDRDLRLPIFGGAFQLRDKFCLVDAANFLDTYESFLAIEKQLAASDIFIINKVDLAERGAVEQIEEVIGEFNPAPVFYEATYAEVPFRDLFRHGGLVGRVSDQDDAGRHHATPGPFAPDMDEQQLDEYIEDLLADEAAQVTPPDRLLSAVFEAPSANEQGFVAWLSSFPPRVVRAKGVVELDGRLRIFNLVNGNWTLGSYEGAPPADGVKDRVVVISRPEDIRALQAKET